MKNRGLRGLRVAYVTCSPWLVTLLFYSSQDHQPRVATYSELGTPHTHQTSIEKMHHRLAHRPDWWGYFLTSSSLFSIDSGLCLVSRKIARTRLVSLFHTRSHCRSETASAFPGLTRLLVHRGSVVSCECLGLRSKTLYCSFNTDLECSHPKHRGSRESAGTW